MKLWNHRVIKIQNSTLFNDLLRQLGRTLHISDTCIYVIHPFFTGLLANLQCELYFV